jgi:hypothetical protein
MADAYSIMSPSFTKPRNFRRSSLSMSVDNDHDTVKDVGPSKHLSSKASQPDSVTGTSSPQKAANGDSRRSVSPPRLAFEAGADSVNVVQSSQLDIKVMRDLLAGKFGKATGTGEYLSGFVSDVVAKLRPNRKPVTVHSIDSSKESDSDDDATVSEDADVEPPLGTAKGTLERTVMRVRVPLTKKAAAKSGLRR